ncbi:MBL fold metallo-hydrolase [Compostimonas suwonensis]|uniref:L-ascorbate metabolism protein UlaG (Beta-lactamase superfamily) n=1 Tax=Compostimonas suwonensis TaxID=1048394 RepID=A0A2M9BZR9_9MICO|nr:MBL fold metallo-hydrolase [Compostimonas suwonensis]PJJ63589.1 L-ascorbate metabolism protein UlaG (beta-lactamase superfamily) [Compostimonas suwonensis]
MADIRLTRFGGPTVLAEIGGWRLLTDPTFDPPGRRYTFGFGSASTKVEGPAADAASLGPIDAVLLSHDHHADNLDDAGRALLPEVPVVVTTRSGRRRLGADGMDTVRGLLPGETTTLSAPGRSDLRITATPCRHGPPLSHPIVGDVIGFAVRLGDSPKTDLWISGDSVLYPALRQLARDLDVDVAVLHLGGVEFGVTGRLRYSMTAEEAVTLLGLLEPRVAVPVHFDGWTHFREGEEQIRSTFEKASPQIRASIVWLPLAEQTTLAP